jgi:hypothetical protein
LGGGQVGRTGIPKRCEFHPYKGFSMEKNGPNWPDFEGIFLFQITKLL